MGLALIAAVAWASYILLNRTLGRRLPGLQGTSAASLLSAVAWTPIALAWFATHTPTAGALAAAIACGVLSSVVPYAADLLALRRVPTQVFGTFQSINPVLAALAGWLLLHEMLAANEWLGIGLIVLANVVVSARVRPATRSRSAVAPGGRGAAGPWSRAASRAPSRWRR